MRAYGENVIVKQLEVPDTTAGGLYIATSAKAEYECRGEIIDVGDARNLFVGDQIIFLKGSKFSVGVGTDQEQYVVVAATDILAVL